MATPCAYTGVSDDTYTLQVPLLAGEGRGWRREGAPLSEKEQVSKGPLFAPISHFIFLTRNNKQSYGFPLPSLLLFLTPGQGKEEAPLRNALPLLGSQGLSGTPSLQNVPLVRATYPCMSVYVCAA